MMNFRIPLGVLLVGVFVSTGGLSQNTNNSVHQDKADIRREEADISKDRVDYKSDQAHITALRHQYQADIKKFGPHSPQAREDKQKLDQAIADLHKDNRERRGDWQEVKHDENDIRKDNKGKWKETKKVEQQQQAAH